MHIITRMVLGGAQENTLLTVEGLMGEPDFEPCLVTGPAIGPEGELLTRARTNGVRIIPVDDLRRTVNPLRDWRAYRRLCKIIRRERPDIVHTHSSKAGILGRRAARACGVPVIVHTIHGLPFHDYENGLRNRLYVFLEKRAARHCDAIITVADAMTEKAVAASIATREQFETIRSGLEIDLFRPPKADERRRLREELGFGENDRVICKVARLFHLKGHEFLLAAMPRILKDVPEAKLLFVGNGILRRTLEDSARRLGIADRLVFTGLVAPERISDYLGASDIVAHCSLREGLARVLPQALLCEVPVVSYDIDGAREVVVDGVTGRLIEPESVEALADAISELLLAPDKAREMGRRGRLMCEEMFDHRSMVRKIAEKYRKLLGAKQK